MDWLTFISSVIDQLISWPIAFIVTVLLLLPQLRRLIPMLRHASASRDNLEVSFGERVEELDQKFEARLPLPIQEQEPIPLPSTEVERSIEKLRQQLSEVQQQDTEEARQQVKEAQRRLEEAQQAVEEAERQTIEATQELQRWKMVYSLAELHPPSAIVQAWQAVEQEAANLAERADITQRRGRGQCRRGFLGRCVAEA